MYAEMSTMLSQGAMQCLILQKKVYFSKKFDKF